MTLFGKDLDELEVVTADFLPDGKKLYILVADSDCNLNVLQYDPEGTKLLFIYEIATLTIWNRPQIIKWRPPTQPLQIPHGSLRIHHHTPPAHRRFLRNSYHVFQLNGHRLLHPLTPSPYNHAVRIYGARHVSIRGIISTTISNAVTVK